MKPVNFYEVLDHKNEVEWGGASVWEAITWFRRGLDRSIFVSVWNEADIENPILITDKIDITSIVLATITSEREKA